MVKGFRQGLEDLGHGFWSLGLPEASELRAPGFMVRRLGP